MLDPVCGMTVGPDAATVDGYPQFGFCSEHCRAAFAANPEKYLGDNTAPEPIEEAATTPMPLVASAAKVDSIHLAVQGMTCASCVSTVETALGSVPGVVDARVNLAAEEATVDIAGSVATEDLLAAVSAAGYSASPIIDDTDGDAEQQGRERLYRSLLRKFWFAALVSLPVIYVAGEELVQQAVEARATHDGYYLAAVPIGDCRFSVAVQLGAEYEYVQVDSINAVPVASFLDELIREEDPQIPITAIAEGMEQLSSDLYRCADTGGFLMIHPPERVDDTPMMVALVFRPIAAWPSANAQAADPDAPALDVAA